MKLSTRRIAFCFLIGLSSLIAAPTQSSSSVPSFAGNAQHTAIFQPPAQNLNAIHWSTPIDLNPGAYAHYGAPLITAANTILVPVKTASDGFQVNAFDAGSGVAKYSLATDYVLPAHSWIPVYNPALTTGSFGTRLYYAGAGGTIYHIDNPDSLVHGTPVQEVFYTTLANYQSNAAAYNAAIFINTPITPDSQGNIFFGFRVQGTAPAPLSTTQSGFARIDPNGNGTYVLAGTAANDANITLDSHNSAPALSRDESTLYIVAKSSSSEAGYLIALDSSTLATKHRVFLTDPRNGNEAWIGDISTASPTIAPDDDVYIGILGSPTSGFRGFLLRFSADLAIQKIPGAFGWDYTAAIVPATMVPSYQGTSSYLIFCKYNNYAFDDGDGINRIALVDPNATQLDPHTSSPGFVEMREVLTIIGPTPDAGAFSTQYPYAVREWCINTAAVNPATNSIFTPSEDGHIYRWNLATNSLSQGVTLNKGIGEPYVPTVIGPDGTVFTINGGILSALGGLNGVAITLDSSMPDTRTVVVGQSLTFTAKVTGSVIPTGTVTFQDLTYQDVTPVNTVLAANVPLDGNGNASVTTSSLTAGNGFLGSHLITVTYSGDGNFSAGSATLVQKVHPSASTATLSSSPNPSSAGQPVAFTATVADVAAALRAAPERSEVGRVAQRTSTSDDTGRRPVATTGAVPTGMVTFRENAIVLAQIPLNGTGIASFTTSSLSPGNHQVTAQYVSDTIFASSSATTAQSVLVGPTPTPALNISGAVGQCTSAGPSGAALANVTMTLTGSSSASTLSDGSGNYSFAGLVSGGNYTVTPTKTARASGSAGINTVDVLAVQRHFLGITLLTGCRLTAADVDGSGGITTTDVIAIQRFYLGLTVGTANVGKYGFTPANRSYAPLISNQAGQNFDVVVFGDCAAPFANP